MLLPPPRDTEHREGAEGHAAGSGRAAGAESLPECTATQLGSVTAARVPHLREGDLPRGALPSCCISVRATQRIPTQMYERALGVIGTDVTFMCGGDFKFKGIIILQVIFCE